jgi:hypothetical protein
MTQNKGFGSWRNLRNKELHSFYSSPGDQIKGDEMGVARRMYGAKEKCTQK